MNTMQFLMVLATMGAGDSTLTKSKNIEHKASVLLTSVVANYPNQFFLEKTSPSLFYHYSRFSPNDKLALVEGRGRFALVASDLASVVHGNLALEGSGGHYEYQLNGDSFIKELREYSSQIDEKYYFVRAEDGEQSLDLLKIKTRDASTANKVSSFFLLQREPKAIATGQLQSAAAADKLPIQYEVPAPLSSLLIQVGETKTIADKVELMKSAARVVPPNSSFPEPAKDPRLIAKQHFAEHFDLLPFKVALTYIVPGKSERKEIGTFAAAIHKTKKRGLIVSPLIGMLQARNTNDSEAGTRDLGNLVAVPMVESNNTPRIITGFNIDGKAFIQHILSKSMIAQSSLDVSSTFRCATVGRAQPNPFEEICKRSGPKDQETETLEIKQWKADQKYFFDVEDVETEDYTWEVEITAQAELTLDFSKAFPAYVR